MSRNNLPKESTIPIVDRQHRSLNAVSKKKKATSNTRNNKKSRTTNNTASK